jgi:hypothetical protein
MSRRRKPQLQFIPGSWPWEFRDLRPVEAARLERVRRQIERTKRRAARRQS